MAEQRHVVIGFDLGGTKMIGAVVKDGEVLSRCKNPTDPGEGPDAVFDKITATIEKAIAKADVPKKDIFGICLAVPGPLKRDKGIMAYTPNLGFVDFPMKAKLEKAVRIPVFLENDVNAGTYGEYRCGAAKGFRHIIALFPGTGIGGGIILDGRLYRGASGNAGELGHMIIQTGGALCGCGQYGCLEALASRTALSKDAVAAASAGKAPSVFERTGSDFSQYKSRVFADAYAADEAVIRRMIHKNAKYLGIGMANCINIFNPEVILLGGGLVEKLGEEYVMRAEQSMRKHALDTLVKDVSVVEAELGDDAVILGAAYILLDNRE